MKKIGLLLLAAAMIVTLSVSASAYFEAEEAFGEVAFSIGKQTAAWNPDGTISDGEYYKVDIPDSWLSYAINDNDTDAGLAYAKATKPELYMSWDETYVYAATRYTVTEGHENLWDGDPGSMWYSGAVQFNYANFDEVASEYRLEYGVGLSSDTGDNLFTVWADGTGEGYQPTTDDAKVWLDGNTLTYETRCPWSAFADEDNTGYKEGNGFNTTFVWSIGKGQDYVHIQLAEGCTGAGKHAENMAQVTLVGAVAAPADQNPMYAEAADGDLLYTVDFHGDDLFSPVPSDFAVDYTTYTPTEDGSGIHVTGNEGFDEEWSFWGSPIAGLNADKTTCYTMTYKVRINGESGKNNSIGIGGLAWNLDAPETYQWRFIENYGNYNSVFPEEDTPNRTALSVSAHKYGDYVNGIENADEDRDGYLTCRLDFNGPENTVKAYCMADGEWTLLEEQQMGEPKEDYAGAYSEYKAVSLYLYTYYEVVDADVKDVKWYKGVNLTDEQLAGQEEVTSPASDAGDNTEVPSRGLADVNTAADGKNIITAYEFVSGTNGNGGEGPENLWDGNTATKFCTGEFPIESIAKLDGVYDITGFTMATANDNADWNGRSPSAWTISVSADGENWTELASGDDSFFEETNFTYYMGEGTASGVSYVKFNAEGAPSGCFQVSEVTLFGDKAVSLDEFLEAKEEAPNTFDFGMIAAVAAVISLGGFAVSKKRK